MLSQQDLGCADEIRLIFNGRVLCDSYTLFKPGIISGNTLLLVMTYRGC
jgi:hypothetical protein